MAFGGLCLEKITYVYIMEYGNTVNKFTWMAVGQTICNRNCNSMAPSYDWHLQWNVNIWKQSWKGGQTVYYI